MMLAVDIGNTEISVGLFEGEGLRGQWRMVSMGQRTPDEWALAMAAHLERVGGRVEDVQRVVYGSVAPAVAGSLRQGLERCFAVEPLEISPRVELPVRLDVEEPLTVGADRIVNTMAAAHLYRADTIVVDFGTATTFDCITADARFLGGVIAPGIRTAADDLALRAAKIPATELRAPPAVIGRRTEDCVRAGVLFGAVDAADGIVRRIKAEWPTANTPGVVATGGLAGLMEPLSTEIERVEPHLTLIGLRIAAEFLLSRR